MKYYWLKETEGLEESKLRNRWHWNENSKSKESKTKMGECGMVAWAEETSWSRNEEETSDNRTVQDTVLEIAVVQLSQHAEAERLLTLCSNLYHPILVTCKSDTGKLITWNMKMKISPFHWHENDILPSNRCCDVIGSTSVALDNLALYRPINWVQN